MPTIPFQSATWQKRSDLTLPTLFGAISGAVQGAVNASNHAGKRVVQVIGPTAHTFTTYYGCASMSFDDGLSWTDSYRGDVGDGGTPKVDAEFVVQTFSLDTIYGTIHYQMRARVQHAFLVADGSIDIGWVRLYASQGAGFQLQQSFYDWPHVIANPASTGGNSVLMSNPACSQPIVIPGSGPDGEDAFWMAASVGLVFGGTNNRGSVRRFDLWRSVDGLSWEFNRALVDESPFVSVSPMTNAVAMFRSTSGRVFILHGGGLAYAVDSNDLESTAWVASVNYPGPNGNLVWPMYGGTLLTHRNGSLISSGFASVSCDDGASFSMVGGGDLVIPTDRSAHMLKIGPSEAICVVPGFNDPTTETVCYYTSDGGETWQGGEVWLSSNIGEKPVFMGLRTGTRPICITSNKCFISTDQPRGVFSTRTVCPLANAGLAAARPLNLCGHAITQNPC